MAAEQDDLSLSRPLRGVTCSAQEGIRASEEPAFIQRDADAAGISEQAGQRAYLPNSPLNAGTSAPSALALPGHEAIAVQCELESNTQKGLQDARRGTAVLREEGRGLSGSLRAVTSLSMHKGSDGRKHFKTRGEKKLKKIKKSSFRLQIGQTTKQHLQSDPIPPLPVLPVPAARATGTIAARSVTLGSGTQGALVTPNQNAGAVQQGGTTQLLQIKPAAAPGVSGKATGHNHGQQQAHLPSLKGLKQQQQEQPIGLGRPEAKETSYLC